MKVLVLSPYPYNTAPGDRFRIEQWARYLEMQEFEFTFASFMDDRLRQLLYQVGHTWQKAALIAAAFLRRLVHIWNASEYDVVFLFRTASLLGPPLLEHLIVWKNLPIVYDFDDAIWVPHLSPANTRWKSLKWSGKTGSICRLSTHVTVGNPYLAEYARRYNPNVSVIPTTIDTETYRMDRPLASNSERPLTIGWTGSLTTLAHLDTAQHALLDLRRHHPFQVLVLGAPDYRIQGLQVTSRQWQAQSEVQDLQQMDIGIMPMPDDQFSRGKCGLKLLQYMALGIPAVASPVGVNTEIVQDGVNGFLASTEEEWVRKLSLLIQDPDLRREMGLASRKTVEERYSAAVWAPRFGEILRNAAARG